MKIYIGDIYEAPWEGVENAHGFRGQIIRDKKLPTFLEKYPKMEKKNAKSAAN